MADTKAPLAHRKKVTIFAPCYNEEATIMAFMETVDRVIAPLRKKYDFTILLVNDGSKDKTLAIMQKLAATRSDFKYVGFSRNFGKERAIYAGFCAAQALNSDAAITMDVDLQDPPELIPVFIREWESGYDYVYGHMRTRKGQGLLKRFFSSDFYKVYALMTKDRTIKSGDRDYAILDRKTLAAFVSLKEIDRFNRGLADFVGFRKKRIYFDFIPRTKGTSKFPFGKMLAYALSSFREFSTFYLLIPDLFIWLALMGLVAFILLGIFAVGWWNYVPVGICALLLPLAIMARIIVKLLYQTREETRKRPLFFVEDTNIEGFGE
mgnify:CR=1 FL=1